MNEGGSGTMYAGESIYIDDASFCRSLSIAVRVVHPLGKCPLHFYVS